MFREAIGLFVPEPKAKLYIPKNSGLHEYVNNLLSEIGVRNGGEFTRVDESVGALEIISARGEDVPQRVDDCLLRGEVAYGLTGDDLFDEYMLGADDSPLGVLNTYDWFDPNAQFYRPALCLLNREGLDSRFVRNGVHCREQEIRTVLSPVSVAALPSQQTADQYRCLCWRH